MDDEPKSITDAARQAAESYDRKQEQDRIRARKSLQYWLQRLDQGEKITHPAFFVTIGALRDTLGYRVYDPESSSNQVMFKPHDMLLLDRVAVGVAMKSQILSFGKVTDFMRTPVKILPLPDSFGTFQIQQDIIFEYEKLLLGCGDNTQLRNILHQRKSLYFESVFGTNTVQYGSSRQLRPKPFQRQ